MADYISNPLLSLVKEQGLIDDLQLDEVLAEQNRSGKNIGQVLHDFGIVELETQLQIIANHLGTEVIELSDKEFSPEVIALIPSTTARMYQCLPLADYGSVLQVTLVDPLNPNLLDELGFVVRKEVQVVVADPTRSSNWSRNIILKTRRASATRSRIWTTTISRARPTKRRPPAARAKSPRWPTRRPSCAL